MKTKSKAKAKAKTKRGAAARAGRRSPRNPTPRKVKVPVGRWKPRVKLTSKGPKRVFKCWNCGAENEITGFGNN